MKEKNVNLVLIRDFFKIFPDSKDFTSVANSSFVAYARITERNVNIRVNSKPFSRFLDSKDLPTVENSSFVAYARVTEKNVNIGVSTRAFLKIARKRSLFRVSREYPRTPDLSRKFVGVSLACLTMENYVNRDIISGG